MTYDTKNPKRGFTLVEVAVVLPIVVAVVAVLVVAMVRLTNESLAQRAENRLAVDVNRALDLIAQDARNSYQFMGTIDTNTTGPQVDISSSNEGSKWLQSAAGDLYYPKPVFGNYLLNASPNNPNRQPVYPTNSSGACDTTRPPVRVNYGYYTTYGWTIPGSVGNETSEPMLWRRSFVQTDVTPCQQSYDQNTCSVGVPYTGTTYGCPAQDKPVLEGYDRIVFFYYKNPTDSTADVNWGINARDTRTVACAPGEYVASDYAITDPARFSTPAQKKECDDRMRQAKKIKLALKGTRIIAGKTISYESSRVVVRQND